MMNYLQGWGEDFIAKEQQLIKFKDTYEKFVDYGENAKAIN